MSDQKLTCWSCHGEIDALDVITKDSRAFCPICGSEFKPFETKTETGKQAEGGGEFLRSCLVVLLVLASIFLILLAFVFAECSKGMGGI